MDWSKKKFSPSCSPIVAQLMKVPHGSSWANLDLLWNSCCLAMGSSLNGPLDSSKTPFWEPRSTRTGSCGFLAFAGELHNHSIDRRKWIAKVLSYLMLVDSTFQMANNSSSLKNSKGCVLPWVRGMVNCHTRPRNSFLQINSQILVQIIE